MPGQCIKASAQGGFTNKYPGIVFKSECPGIVCKNKHPGIVFNSKRALTVYIAGVILYIVNIYIVNIMVYKVGILSSL